MFSHWIISTIRAQETVAATSPAAVVARMEREQADYLSYVAGTTDRGTYRALLDAVARATTWAPILVLALGLMVSTAHAAPDAAATARALQQDFAEWIAADAVLSTRAGQRLVLSSLLCLATELHYEDAHTTAAGRARIVTQMESARQRLAILDIEPLACDSWPVARLVGCLSILPSIACTELDDLHAQVLAAERLEEVRP